MQNARDEASGIENDSVREAIFRGTQEVDRAYRELRGGESVEVEGETAVRYAISVGGVLFTVITVLIVAFYWLTEKTLIKRAFINAIPAAGRERVYHAWEEIEKRIGGWARGQLTLMLIIGVVSTIAYGAMGLDFWLALGLIAGLTEAIPFIGPFIGGAAAVAVALTDSFEKVILVIVFVVILQQIEGALLVPRVMRNAVGMTPLTVVLAVLIGSRLGGPLGAILAIPVGAAVQAIIQESLRRDINAADVTPDALNTARLPQIRHLGRLRRRPRTQAP
jgi:predicted PurR-regulated permease PerM